MPFSGEHSCRLIAPGEFSEFRRQNNFRQIDGKRVDAIVIALLRTVFYLSLQASLRYGRKEWPIKVSL